MPSSSFAGYLLAKLLEKAIDRTLARVGLNRWLERGGVMDAMAKTAAASTRRGSSRTIVFWLVMFVVLTVAANALGLTALADVFSELVSYLPSVIAAIIIIPVGIVLGEFVDGLILASAANPRRADIGPRGPAGRGDCWPSSWPCNSSASLPTS